MLHHINAANLFLVALDDERTRFRYHCLVRQLLRAELRTKDRDRQQALQLRAADGSNPRQQPAGEPPLLRQGRPAGHWPSCRIRS